VLFKVKLYGANWVEKRGRQHQIGRRREADNTSTLRTAADGGVPTAASAAPGFMATVRDVSPPTTCCCTANSASQSYICTNCKCSLAICLTVTTDQLVSGFARLTAASWWSSHRPFPAPRKTLTVALAAPLRRTSAASTNSTARKCVLTCGRTSSWCD
jgi:hypothetical protein